jgi:2-dehydro-3-deoxyphosphogluconate aldolase/(4S)-4-hydroxy-2-oxoglutarate aldolase
MNEIINRIQKQAIIPVITVDSSKDAEWVCEVLVDAGMQVIEITFRTEAAVESIAVAKSLFPDLIIGAGTVLSLKQASRAAQAGATFLVSPALDVELVEWSIQNQLIAIPGVVTPTEILTALKHGVKVMKFFPAEAYGGTKTIDALKGPFPDVKFLPTGGINSNNAIDYLRLSNVIAVGGTWMVKPDLIKKRDKKTIYQLSTEALQIVKSL